MSALNRELEAACNDPKNFDFGFEAQRQATGFANFGFDPVKAAEMRQVELDRIAAEMEEDEPEFDDEDDDWDDVDTDCDVDDEPFDDSFLDDEEEDEFDRYETSYDFDDEDEDSSDEF